MPKVFGSADVNCSTEPWNCARSPYGSQAIGPLIPSNLVANTASRSAFLPMYRLPVLSGFATLPTNRLEPIEFRPIDVIGRVNEAPPALLVAPEHPSPTDEHR